MDSSADEIVSTAEGVIITPRLCKGLVFSVPVFHILTSDIRAAFLFSPHNTRAAFHSLHHMSRALTPLTPSSIHLSQQQGEL